MRKFAENLVDIKESNVSNYKKLKEGEDIKSGDYLHIYEDTYAEIGKGNIICKQKVSKNITILRKK
jgi:hypothetical protein